MKRSIRSLPALLAPASACAMLLCACGGGGGSGGAMPPPPAAPGVHLTSISWLPSREAAVNSPGGGYIVNISGQAPITCPFTGFAPPCMSQTSVQVTLQSGNYTVTVTAYSALRSPGSAAGSTSAPSAPLMVRVP